MRLPIKGTQAMQRWLAHFAAITAMGVCPCLPASARVLTQAPDVENGARVFAYVCSACHLGGYNQVRPEKTLVESVLRDNGMFAADAIEYQVTNGMPSRPAALVRCLLQQRG